MLEHIPNYEQAIKEINRVLKNEGSWLLSFPSKYSYREWTNRIKVNLRKNAENPFFLEHLHFFSEREIKNILKKEGFKIRKRNYGCYLFPLLNRFLGKNRIIDTLFLKFEDILSKKPLRNLAWNIVYLCNRDINIISPSESDVKNK